MIGLAGYVIMSTTAIAVVMSISSASAAAQTAGIKACRPIADNEARLACYDREVRKLVPPTFAGRLSKTTSRFHISRPTLLRYESDGPIFVLYLKAADGSVIQNLHIGGGGESSYLIEQTGTYFLDVNGSESWRIWLEPETRHPTN